MKKSCEPDNINIFELDYNTIEKYESNLSIKNCYWTPNKFVNKIIV